MFLKQKMAYAMRSMDLSSDVCSSDLAWTYVSAPPSGAAKGKAYKVEIADAAQVGKVFAELAADLGGAPSCVVANAGINVPPGPLAQFDPANFRRLVEVNIVGAFNILQEIGRAHV